MLHNRFWQAFFALAPILLFFVAMIGYFIFIFSMIGDFQEIENSEGPPTKFLAGMGIFLILILFAVLISIGSLIFYIMHAVQNENLKESNLLIVWILLFVLVGGIGQLIYWIVEIVTKRNVVDTAKTNLQ